jgi:choice-of-anchor B domain-containing protein
MRRVAALLLFGLVALMGAASRAQAQSRYAAGPPAMSALGSALVVDGSSVYIGRPGQTSFFPAPSDHVGTVHEFAADAAGKWTERSKVTSTSAAIDDQFGAALDVKGNRMAVGAPKQNSGRGAVYIFERPSARSPWREVAKLTDSGGRENDLFGSAVGLAGETVFVGVPGRSGGKGAAIVYSHGASGWTAGATLQGSGTGGGDGFGSAISASAERVLIGAPGPKPWASLVGGGQPKTGAAFVFANQNGQWREDGKLTRSSAPAPLAIGAAVTWADDEALVSAPLANQFAGAILQFRRGNSGWSEAGEITASRPQPGTGLGISLAAAGPVVIAGAPIMQGTGGAFIFGRNALGNWSEVQAIKGDDQFGFMGGAVGASASLLVIGAPGADFFLGAGYAYTKPSGSAEWTRAEKLVSEETKLDPITGGQRDCQDGKVGPFPCAGVDVVSFLPVDALGGKRGVVLNDLWGWTDEETGHEYALVGRTNGTSFVDVTDGSNPVYLGDLPLHEGANINVWRDIKVYRNHAYIVADGAGDHGVQIFDLTQLRNVPDKPATFKETAHYAGIASAHNIVINEESGFGYVVGSNSGGETCGGGLHMIDLHDPENPKFAGCFADARTGNARTGYSHDAMCTNYHGPQEKYRGHEICFGSNETALSIADVTDKGNPVPISTATYPNVAYQHQGWISEDHRYYYTDDEEDELAGTVNRTRTLIWDIQDLEDPVLIKEYLGETGATDHNLYVKGHYLYESNYVAGLRIIDVSDPKNPVETGFFDTVPWGANAPGFAGTWSNYPFFKSGNILVSSMREGLFILKQRMRPIS